MKKLFFLLFIMLMAVPAFAGHQHIDKPEKTILGVDRVGEADVDAIFTPEHGLLGAVAAGFP